MIGIKNDIECIEKHLFNAKFDSLNNYYNCLNEDEVCHLTNDIFLTLKKEDNFSIRNPVTIISNLLDKHLVFTFINCIYIKSYADLLYFYLSFFVIKSFQTYHTQINNEKFHNFNNYNLNSLNFYESDDLINWSSNEFFNLNMALNLILNLKIDVTRETIREIFIKIFFICINHNLIQKTQIKSKFSKKTYNYLYINIKFNLNNINIKVYSNQFTLFFYKNNTFLYCNHYSFIVEINRKNMLSNFKFEQNINFSVSLTQNYFYIDKYRLMSIIEDLLSFYSINKNCIQEKFFELQELLKKGIFEKNIYLISNVSKEMAIYLNLIKLINISLLDLTDLKIYTPHIICFRGRFSSLSDTSYTFNKEFRYCIYSGFYKKDEIIEKSDVYVDKINKIIMNYKFLLKKCNLITSLDDLNNTQIKSLLFLTINLAELHKVKLGKKITIEQFITEGVDIINNFNNMNFTDVYDKIKIKYYLFIFNEILSNSSKKWLISKDATASCFQHLIKILGYENINSVTICNLNSLDTWYDTYQSNIDFFLEKKILLNLTKDDIKLYFNRKFLKPTQMKESYGMLLQNFLNEYKTNISEFKIPRNKFNELIKLFCDFYYFLKTNSLLFKHRPIEIINKICDEFGAEGIVLKNGEKLNLKYFKPISVQKSYYIGKTRYTKNFQALTNKLDTRKMSIAARANYAQAMESAVARATWLETKCPIIHDCFMIDMHNQSYLISVVNKNMNKTYHDLKISKWDVEIFSFFIIL
uniref:Uncharacterized protein n=1 Tax=Pseudourostyla cristata TaxID=293816 RepID=A0A4P9JLE2_9SPIT|nr:hypothetical protein [Pseudourostyla cristata]